MFQSSSPANFIKYLMTASRLSVAVLSMFSFCAKAEETPAKPDPPPSITKSDRLARYIRETCGPVALLRAGFSSGMDHLHNNPPEWRQGSAGYSRRLASRFSRTAVAKTIEYGAGALIDEDPRYLRRGHGGFLTRTGYALSSAVVARDSKGRRRFAAAHVAGVYGGAMIATSSWYPSRYTALGDGVRLANISLASGAGFNVLREFWPDVKRAFRKQ